MNIDSSKVSDTLSNIVSSVINKGFEVAHNETTLKSAAVSTLQETIDGVSDVLSFEETDSGLGDIKNGIYSIVYAGLTSGLEGVEYEDDVTISSVLELSKEAALSKTKQVLPDMLCNKIQEHVSSSVSKIQADREESFIRDSAEILASNGMANLQNVLNGDVELSDALIDSVKETAAQITDEKSRELLNKAIDKFGIGAYVDADEFLSEVKSILDGDVTVSEVAKEKAFSIVQDKIAESLSKRRTSLEEKKYKSNARKDTALFAQDSMETFASIGMENIHGVLSGSIDIDEAIDNTITDTTKEISDKAVNGAINKACDKLGLSKYLDPSAVIDTAKNVKDCFVEYTNGEITYEQFFLKIGEDGLFQVAQAWGTSIGTSIVVSTGMQGVAAAITAAASSTIITAVYSELYKYALNVFEEEIASKKRLEVIRALSAEAIDVIRAEREFLLNSTFIQVEKRQKVFNESLESMAVAIETNDVELLTQALNKITTEVGGTIQFTSFEEFDEFMLDDSSVFEF